MTRLWNRAQELELRSAAGDGRGLGDCSVTMLQGTVDAEMTPGATRGQTRGSFATKKR